MKYGDSCVVCFDGKISRGVYGVVTSSTQYRFSVRFTYFGKVRVVTFRKHIGKHKRFTYGTSSGMFLVIPSNQLKSWYPTYIETVDCNTLQHSSNEGCNG